MPRLLPALSSITFMLFAAFSSSPNYNLNNYSVGSGATNSAASTSYKLQGSVGEQANGSTAGSTKTGNNGSIQTEQLNLPPAPTLSNGSGTYYNMLNCIVNTGGNPSDTTYAIEIATNSGFTSPSFVQASGVLGGSAVYQSYSPGWGGGSGFFITGLTSSTTYYVKVAAKEGLFTNTEYGASSNASTVSPTITFSVSPNSSSIGSFLPGNIVTSSNLSFTYATNAAAGGDIYVFGTYNGFRSPSSSYTIPAFSGNLTGASQGFGMQATNPGQTSGGPLTTVSPFNGTGNVVGAETTNLQPIFATTAAIVGATGNANIQAKASTSVPPANDYQEVFTFVAAASF